jgi:hypothetical protein
MNNALLTVDGGRLMVSHLRTLTGYFPELLNDLRTYVSLTIDLQGAGINDGIRQPDELYTA